MDPADEPTGQRRNLLVVMADEFTGAALDWIDVGRSLTPNIDRVRARGVSYDRCWTPSPICVPARAAFASGQWVHRTRHWDSTLGYAGEPRSWMHAARAAGVHTVSFGKLHHQGASFDDGFVERRRPMFLAGGVGWTQGLPRWDPIPYAEAAELADQVGVGDTSYTRYDRRICDDAVAWLGHEAPASPWAAFVSFVAPHYPLSAPTWAHEIVRGAEVAPPRHGRGLEHPAVEAMADFFGYGDFFDHDTTLAGRRAYAALVVYVDSLLGEVLDALERSGAGADTTVVFTSDHGDLVGERGLWCKSFMFDASVSVPMVVAGPGVPEGVRSRTAVNLVDVAPTATAALGVEVEPSWVGSSLLDPASLAPDRVAFSEYHDGGSITGSFAIEVDRWKYVHHEGHRPELYDRMDDPDERVDLAAHGGPPEVLDRCDELLRSIVDPTAVNDAAFADQRRAVAELGGREVLVDGIRFNHTPVPE